MKETFIKRDKFSVGETLNVSGNSVSLVIEMYNKKRKREWNGSYISLSDSRPLRGIQFLYDLSLTAK